MIRVLIAEDSAVTREYLEWILGQDPELEVAGVAHDGEQALALAERLRPDVILMDVHMPVLDGFDATRLIMERVPTPIVMATASTSRAFQALEAGALVLLEKPGAPWEEGSAAAADELVRTVKLMAEVKVVRRWAPRGNGARRPARLGTPRVVAVGASTGGPQVVSAILGALPRPLGVPLLLVQHMSYGFIDGFVDWLDSRVPVPVRVASPEVPLTPGTVHVAGGGQHLTLTRDGHVTLDDGPAVNGFRPSISRLFDSVADVYGPDAVGVLLTGMGRDGADGLRRMRDAGALTIAQDAESSVVFGMPGEAVRLDAAAEVLPPPAIVDTLRRLA
ncbi:MAG TPA: chemotaxis-specific protein-glutamate methyltransferase CheB [Solirubrobacter sp.]|nr:chemotaxis-specific protein-glutamate methyltransferase CheB [Solirubrobacter sp.]